jgi:6-pyruvoyltetrahydropterin/6-carboxytetrahydropterin synthase
MHFSSAHFVIGADYCEALHGHNYHVEATLTGPLDAQGMVMDFRDLKGHVVHVCSQLDHRILLPGKSDEVVIQKTEKAVKVQVNTKQYEFPAEDCAILPIKATTAELLAEFIASKLQIPDGYSLELCVSEDVGSRGCFRTP